MCRDWVWMSRNVDMALSDVDMALSGVTSMKLKTRSKHYFLVSIKNKQLHTKNFLVASGLPYLFHMRKSNHKC